MVNKTVIGHLAAAGAYAIFGFNILTCRAVGVDGTISPMLLFTFRAGGAALLFWVASAFMPKEKIDRGDYLKIFIASMLGLFLTQIVFLKAVTIATPFDCAIITSFTPIFTMLVAAIAIKEPITWRKTGGVLLSLAGVLALIFNSAHSTDGATHTSPLGVVLMLCNGLFFAMYLGIFRPLIVKYSVVTFMKWMFLFSLLVSLPFSGRDLVTANYSALPLNIILDVLFTVVFATFIAYFLIPVAQKNIRPTIISMYAYLQPMIAAAVGIYLGMDHFSLIKLISAIMVFTGVWIVQHSRSRIG